MKTTERHEGSRGVAPSILNLDTRWWRIDNFTPLTLYPRDPKIRRWNEPESLSSHSESDENLLNLQANLIEKKLNEIPLMFSTKEIL
jgi:hypothetical protein